jgi:peptidase E
VSAGSIIIGPSIEIAAPFDKNESNITDFRGLNIIDKVLSPHYTKKEERLIKKYRTKFKILPLKDNEALLIKGNKEKIIR